MQIILPRKPPSHSFPAYFSAPLYIFPFVYIYATFKKISPRQGQSSKSSDSQKSVLSVVNHQKKHASRNTLTYTLTGKREGVGHIPLRVISLRLISSPLPGAWSWGKG